GTMSRLPFRRLFRLPWRSRGQIRAEVDEEIRFHLEMRAEELQRGGLPPAEARARARREFGDVEAARDALRHDDERRERTVRRGERLHEAARDARLALRVLRTDPGFCAVVVLTLGIGIGASTAMFSVLDGVLLSPLPVRDQDRVAVMWAQHPERGTFHAPLPYADLLAFQEQTRAFERVAGIDYNGAWPSTLLDGGNAVPAKGTWVTGDLFGVLGVVPALGRVLLPADDVVGADPVMVIGHGFWQ